MKEYWKIFSIFFKLGLTTIGGGYVMLPLLQRELVEKQKWYSEEEFVDILAIAQSSPGPIVVNAAMLIGYRKLGVFGGILSVFGAVLPAFSIILLVSVFFFEARDNEIVMRLFQGIRPAVVGLIGAAAIGLTKVSIKKAKKSLLLTIISFVMISFLGISPVFALLGATGVGLLFQGLTKEDA